MDRDQIEARILWHYQLATEQSIRGAMADPRHTAGQDLSGVLVAVGLLTREQAEWVRKQVYNEYRKAAAARAEAEQGPARKVGPYQTDAAAFDEIKSIIRAREPEPSEEIQNDLAEIQAMLNPGAPAAPPAPAQPRPAQPRPAQPAQPRQVQPAQPRSAQPAQPRQAGPAQPAQPRAKAPSSRKVARPGGGQKSGGSKRIGGQKSGGAKRIGGQKSGCSKRVGGLKSGGSTETEGARLTIRQSREALSVQTCTP